MSNTSAVPRRRVCTRSIQRPERSAKAVRFAVEVIAPVSKRPIWLVDEACCGHCTAADDPAHRRIASEAVSIVHVLVAGEAPEHRLAKLGDQAVATVSPGAGVGENLGRHLREAQGVVEFPEREQPGIGGGGRAVEFQLQPAVERDPQPHPSASPVASSICRPLYDRQTLALHSRFTRQRHRSTRSFGKSGLRLA